MAIYIKKWNGSAWVNSAVKRWNGSAWVDAYTYKWDGSKWFQLYPETIVSNSYTLASSSSNNLRSWREGSSSTGYETAKGTAKQGPYSSYTPAYGHLDVNSSSLPGSGNISSISSATMNSVRGGSGSYNAAKTMFFYRSASYPESKPTLIGSSFTCTAPGVGSGGTMSNVSVNVNSETLNYANQVGGGKFLWIYTNDSNHYMSVTSYFKITFSYQYLARTALFVDSGEAVAYNISNDRFKEETGDQVYHRMPIYAEEAGMTLEEIIQRREDGVVEDIDPTNVIITPEIKPWFRDHKVVEEDGKLKVKVEAMHQNEDSEAQYSLDNVTWHTLCGTKDSTEYVEAILPPDFNKYKDDVYLRIINKKQDFIYTDLIIRPLIYIP
jgi:hypothetical protein